MALELSTDDTAFNNPHFSLGIMDLKHLTKISHRPIIYNLSPYFLTSVDTIDVNLSFINEASGVSKIPTPHH
jgi:hypothetical protein